MSANTHAFTGGFSDPVFQSQSIFRMLMDGMARPGSIHTVEHDAGQPDPLGPAAGAIALTLCDHDTPVWLSAGLSKSAIGDWICFHSGAPMTREKAKRRRHVSPSSRQEGRFLRSASSRSERRNTRTARRHW